MPWNPEQVENDLLAYIVSELVGDRPDLELRPEDDLLTSGLVDSLGVMRLIRYIEERTGLAVPPADVTIEHFLSVQTIMAYLQGRQAVIAEGGDLAAVPEGV